MKSSYLFKLKCGLAVSKTQVRGLLLASPQPKSFKSKSFSSFLQKRGITNDGRNLTRGRARLSRMSSIELVPSVSDEPQAISDSLLELQSLATKERVPWFQSSMPDSYFKNVPRERRLRHLVSVASIPDIEEIPDTVSKHYDQALGRDVISVISSGKTPKGRLEKQLRNLPWSTPLNGMSFYTSKDGLINVTEFILKGDKEPSATSNVHIPKEILNYVNELQQGKFETDRKQYLANTGQHLHAKPADYFSEEKLVDFMKLAADKNFVERTSPRRFCKFVQIYHKLLEKGTDEVHVDVESNWKGNPDQSLYTLALTNVMLKPVLIRITKYLESQGLSVDAVILDSVAQDRVFEESKSNPDYNNVAFVRLLAGHKGKSEPFLERVKDALPLVAKWYDDDAMSLFYEVQSSHHFAEELDLQPVDFEVLYGLMSCVHLVKSGTEMYEFSKPNVELVANRPQAYEIVNLFKDKHDPKGSKLDAAAVAKKAKEIRASVNQYVEVEMERRVLDKMLDIVEGTSRTNLFNPDRFAFSFKLDPKVCMDPKDKNRTETPFGVFFVSGRRFRGLQVRFREIARGGLRLVTPNSPQSFTIESTRQFGECYDLAFAQQQKNKDIAEGGSKAVCLIDLPEEGPDRERTHILRRSVKAFVNSILDLITVHDTNSEEELIFLGPDEQITIEHINWIVRRAEERNYRMPSAFMSSKPDQGINHKEFGVTSEGVSVFLDVALKNLDMLPTEHNNKDTFSVKITGGPDGDVAGNMLKILHREYGEKCRVVGIADGTGCVEDPQGISWDELLRLFKKSLPLDQIDKSRLASTTEVHTLEKAEGVLMRNTMHNRVKADALITGGGRPATINESNWEKFLDEDGKPSSKLIVEGANLFLTNVARKKLAEKGAVVVKDSSANKCGVICSSFEIISCMLLDKPKFLEIKSELVPQVLDKLRSIAKKEAELLMTEYRKNTSSDGVSSPDFNLVDVSIEISHAINRATDCIRESISKTVENDKSFLDQYLPLVKAFLPEKLVEAGWDHFTERVPEVYVVNLVSTILACELVYSEGVDFVSAIKDDQVLTDTAMSYIEQKQMVRKLIDELNEGSELSKDNVKVIRKLLELGGPKAALVAGGLTKILES